MKHEALIASGNISRYTHFTANSVMADTIGLSYDTMPGNSPKQYQNFVAIWQNQNQIPWNLDPENTHKIEAGSQAGSSSFDGLDVTNNSYIIGYGVGPKISNICSTVFVPEGQFDPTKAQLFHTSVSTVFVGTTSVTFKFQTPVGYTPKTNKNWAGIWRGSTVPYVGDPIKKVDIALDVAEGSQGINGIELLRATTYSIGYFTGPDQTNLAASVTFTV